MPMPSDDSAASAIVVDKLTGRHVLHIEGYSHTKALINGYCLLSQPFNFGGRAWCIWYYPHGAIDQQGVWHRGYISVYLVLADDNPEPAYAEATFHLLDQAENPVPACSRSTGLGLYSSAEVGHEIANGFPDFISKEFLEASEYLVDECYKIRFDVSLWKECATESRPDPPPPPPPDLHRHLGDLLVSKEGAGVTFHVDGRKFSAHRSVVAARLPVLKAMLFGTSAAAAVVGACVIRIDGVAPRVFKALLHFVYTDSLPAATGRWQYDAAMDLQLLGVADRFGMQRLRLICEERLCRYIKVDTAAGFLLLAHQRGCHTLREACVEFLKCPRALNAVMATDGFEHLVKTCPALLKDLISKLAAR